MTTSLPVLRAAAMRARRARHRIHHAGGIVHAHAGLLAPSRPAAEWRRDAGRRSRRAAGGGPASAATSRAWRRSSSCPSPEGRASGSRADAPTTPAARPWRRRRAPSSSSRTILTTCWLGVRLLRTAWSIARSRTRSTNALTTLKLTSASSSASPDFAQRGLDRLFGETGLALERLEDVLEAGAERVEHEPGRTRTRRNPAGPPALRTNPYLSWWFWGRVNARN